MLTSLPLEGRHAIDIDEQDSRRDHIPEQRLHPRADLCLLYTSGHQINDADDLLWRDGSGKWFRGRRIPNPNTHGTGGTLSSAIAANLAKGYDLDRSVERAKAYISGALAAMLDLGRGSGPMNHMFDLKGGFAE